VEMYSSKFVLTGLYLKDLGDIGAEPDVDRQKKGWSDAYIKVFILEGLFLFFNCRKVTSLYGVIGSNINKLYLTKSHIISIII